MELDAVALEPKSRCTSSDIAVSHQGRVETLEGDEGVEETGWNPAASMSSESSCSRKVCTHIIPGMNGQDFEAPDERFRGNISVPIERSRS